jgi:copper(I)-binding protein
MNKIKMLSLTMLFLVAITLAGCSPTGELSIKEQWARPGMLGANSAIYFILDNPSNQADTLLSAKTDVAAVVELHETMMMAAEETDKPVEGSEHGQGKGMEGGEVMKMMPQENVPVPAQSQVEFKPGGLHVMLIDLQRELSVGDTFQVTLVFQNAGEMQLEVTVKEPLPTRSTTTHIIRV